MKYGKLVLERLKEPENSIEHWRDVVEQKGVEHVRKLLEPPLPVSAVWPISARQAIEEHEDRQLKQRVRQEKASARAQRQREDDAIELAREANRIADGTRKETRYGRIVALFVGAAIIAVSVWAALLPEAQK